YVPDVPGVQIASAPQMLGVGAVLVVALGKPWGAHHDLSGGAAVVRLIVHVFVHDAKVHQGTRLARLRATGIGDRGSGIGYALGPDPRSPIPDPRLRQGEHRAALGQSIP